MTPPTTWASPIPDRFRRIAQLVTAMALLLTMVVAVGPQPVAAQDQPTHRLRPGNLNNQWPTLRPGDVVHLDPGVYTGGEINLSVEGTSSAPVKIVKTPGTSGRVVLDGQGRNNMFNITGAHIELGGSTVGANWEPDLVITDTDYAGIRMRATANDIHLHHIHFDRSGQFGVRMNGQRVLFEYNRIEDPGADALQAETGGGVNISDWTVRYNYGSNRLSADGPWAFNAASHADFIQIQRGPARDIDVVGNLMIGYTNPIIAGNKDDWSATNVSLENNFILFEANGVSTNSGGDVRGTYRIVNNHLVMYQVDGVDGGGASAILLKNPVNGGSAVVDCNVFYGIREAVNTNIDGSVSMSSTGNIRTGLTTSMSEISSVEMDLGYRVVPDWHEKRRRDLSGIFPLRSVKGGANCAKPQGASFVSVAQHLNYINDDDPQPGGQEVTATFNPTDDAFVRVGSNYASNGDRLRIRTSSTTTYESFMKFDVTGVDGPVVDGKLRLTVPTDSQASNDGGDLYLLSQSANGWTETAVTGVNRPTERGTLVDEAGDARGASTVDFDIGSAIDGDGTYTLALRSGSTWSGYYYSKDQPNAEAAPELSITYRSSGDPQPPVGGGTYTFDVAEDATVRVGSTAGWTDQIRVRTSSSTTYHAYLKFNVAGIGAPIKKATLKLHVQAESNDGGSVYEALDNSWSEGTINGINAPGDNGTAVGRAGDLRDKSVVLVDVTAAIDGNGIHSFVLRSNSSWSGYYIAKEVDAARSADLIIETE